MCNGNISMLDLNFHSSRVLVAFEENFLTQYTLASVRMKEVSIYEVDCH